MKSNSQRPAKNRSVEKTKKGKYSPTLSVPHIEELIDSGMITIGMLGSVCVATAADDDMTYATLVRRRGESLAQLLVRLDHAVDNAISLGLFTDQLNR